MQQKEFNLLFEPWILVLNMKGEQEEVSLLTALERAHEFKCLAGELPTQDVAILRLLLATLYATFTRADAMGERSAIKHPEEAMARWKSLWDLGKFPMGPINKRLTIYEERFYLFHPERPFYQVAGMDKGTDYSAAKLLGNLSESSNKLRLFPTRTGEAKKTITYSEAARWILHLNAFDDTSSKPSVRGQKMLSPGAGWLGKLGLIYSAGDTLFETLLYNFVLLKNGELWDDDMAVWELDEVRKEERVEIALPQGPLALLTMQSRRLLLKRKEKRVEGYKLLGGDFFQKENAVTEQMTIWRKDAKTENYLPKRHEPDRQLWRSFAVLTAKSGNIIRPGVVEWLARLKENNFIRNIVVLRGASIIYGKQDYFVTDVFTDELSLNSKLLSSLSEGWIIRISHLLELTESCVNKLFGLAVELAKASGDSDSKGHTPGGGTGDAAKAEAFFRLDMPFRKWLAEINPEITDIDEAESRWKETLKKVVLDTGEEMVRQSGEKAITGRRINERLYTSPGALISFKTAIKKVLDEGM